MGRLLTSKKLRAALYYAQDGKCAICKQPLPDNWHADHIVPWTVTKRTNIHEMQALCPKCNLQKGSTMGLGKDEMTNLLAKATADMIAGLRKHQSELAFILKRIAFDASEVRNIGLYVSPGGGKSAVAMIVSAILAEKRGYKVCVVVPRDALRTQGETGFVDIENRKRYGHTTRIRAAGNIPNPSGDDIGYITTYQAVNANPDLHLQEFRRHKYVLILDECHHVPEGGDDGDDGVKASYRTIAPLFEAAAIRILMTGTLARHDGKAIAFWPYKRYAAGPRAAVTTNTPDLPDWAFVRYNRQDGLRDGAIVPLHFYRMDGWAAWKDPLTGESREVDSFENASNLDIGAKALRAAVSTEFANDLLGKCFESWTEHRTHTYTAAKMLVIAPSIETAKQYTKYIKSLGGLAMIATSWDTPEATTNIERFKKDGQILVTVGMAYEGLDVPEITHVALLTNIRSRPWIEQCVCRANRSAKGKNYGYIFHPADVRMNAIMGEIEMEQAQIIYDDNWIGRPRQPGQPARNEQTPIIPEGSGSTGSAVRDPNNGIDLGYAETQWLEAVMQEVGLRGVSVVQINQLLERVGVTIPKEPAASAPKRARRELTPSEEEKHLRIDILNVTKDIANAAYSNKEAREQYIIQLNSEIKRRFYPNKERGAATVSELTAALQWVYTLKRNAP